MAINQDTAAEQYQNASDALMDIAQDYNVSAEMSEIAMNAANHLTLQYIEQAIEDVNQLNSQYASFINYMEGVIADLENTLIDDVLIVPLQKALNKAKKSA